MPAINFSTREGQMVTSGEIFMAIRRRKPSFCYEGSLLFLWQNQRTKTDHKFLGKKFCKSIQPIEMLGSGVVNVVGYTQEAEDLESLAIATGYKTFAIMERYFKMRFGLPYLGGTLIEW